MTSVSKSGAPIRPATEGPLLRLDTSNAAAVSALRQMRDEMEAAYRKDAEWRAPEQFLDYPFHYVEVILDVLLEKGQVLTWEASRQAPEYPTLGSGFDKLCIKLSKVDGVEIINP